MIVALMPTASKAQEYKLIEPLPCIAGTSTGGNCATTQTINLNDYIGYIFKFSIALAAFLAVIMIIWGGFQYMTSEAPFLKVEGKNKIGGAIGGLIMILASYLILATIDPRLVEINTSIPPITFCTAANQTGCVNKDGKFAEDLQKDLSILSQQLLIKNSELNEQIKTEEAKLKDLTSAVFSGEATPEQEVEYAKANQKIAELKSEKERVAANAYSNTVLKNSLDLLHEPLSYSNTALGGYVSLGDTATLNSVSRDTLEQFKNDINAFYAKKIQAETRAEYKQNLMRDRDFYIGQINDERNAMVLVGSYNLSKTSSNKKNLEEGIKNSEAELKEVETSTYYSPEITDKYKMVLQDRIARMKSFLTN
mgnify:FL=1